MLSSIFIYLLFLSANFLPQILAHFTQSPASPTSTSIISTKLPSQLFPFSKKLIQIYFAYHQDSFNLHSTENIKSLIQDLQSTSQENFSGFSFLQLSNFSNEYNNQESCQQITSDFFEESHQEPLDSFLLILTPDNHQTKSDFHLLCHDKIKDEKVWVEMRSFD